MYDDDKVHHLVRMCVYAGCISSGRWELQDTTDLKGIKNRNKYKNKFKSRRSTDPSIQPSSQPANPRNPLQAGGQCI